MVPPLRFFSFPFPLSASRYLPFYPLSLSLPSRLLHRTVFVLNPIASRLDRPFIVMTATRTDEQYNSSGRGSSGNSSSLDTDLEDGQVKIHTREKPTQAELEKEIWQEAHRLACEVMHSQFQVIRFRSDCKS